MNGASDDVQRKFLKEVLVLEEKNPKMENELHEASEELRRFTVERKEGGGGGAEAF